MPSTKQQGLATFGGDCPTDTGSEIGEEFESHLKNHNINDSKIAVLNKRFGTLPKLFDATDTAITSQSGIGEETLDKVRDADPANGEPYKIVKQDGEYTIAEWDLKADDRSTILTGNEILNALLRAGNLGHHSTISKRLAEWAKTHRTADDSTTDRSLWKSIYNLTPDEINFGGLYDPEETFETPQGPVTALKEATTKANALIAFCNETERKHILTEAKSEATAEIKSKIQARKEARKQKQLQEEFISDPPETIHGWELIETTAADVYAYNGVFQKQPSVISLFEDEEFVRVRVFSHNEWEQINQAVTPLTDELNRVDSTATGRTPETLQEGATELIDFLSYNETTAEELASLAQPI